MGVIPSFYSSDSEYYITVPTIQSFFESIGKKQSLVIRQELFNALEEYANESQGNKENVLSWLDRTLREGATEIHLFNVQFDAVDLVRLADERWIDQLLHQMDGTSPHFAEQPQSERFSVINCKESTCSCGRVISFSLYRTVYVKPKNQAVYTLNYPAFVDVYVDRNLLAVRGKSKSTMYQYTSEMETFDDQASISTETLLSDAIVAVREFSELSLKSSNDLKPFKERLYRLLKKYTETPVEIASMMEESKPEIENVVAAIKDTICRLPDSYNQRLQWDVRNLVEKYFSISYPDKSIFKKDRDAFPLKLTAKDEEESKVEQVSGFSEPLQSKAVFFDNKTMMQDTKCCEGISFRYQRRNRGFFTSNEFNVTFLAKTRYFMIKFTEYTTEEDIQNVLFSLLEDDAVIQ